jgi:hypothetical protein
MIASHSSFPLRIVQPVPSRSRRTNTQRTTLDIAWDLDSVLVVDN